MQDDPPSKEFHILAEVHTNVVLPTVVGGMPITKRLDVYFTRRMLDRVVDTIMMQPEFVKDIVETVEQANRQIAAGVLASPGPQPYAEKIFDLIPDYNRLEWNHIGAEVLVLVENEVIRLANQSDRTHQSK
jgi:hypothetical protein